MDFDWGYSIIRDRGFRPVFARFEGGAWDGHRQYIESYSLKHEKEPGFCEPGKPRYWMAWPDRSDPGRWVQYRRTGFDVLIPDCGHPQIHWFYKHDAEMLTSPDGVGLKMTEQPSDYRAIVDADWQRQLKERVAA